jgi:hypothetical protein
VKKLQEACNFIEIVENKSPSFFSFPMEEKQPILLVFDDLYDNISKSAAFNELMTQ